MFLASASVVIHVSAVAILFPNVFVWVGQSVCHCFTGVMMFTLARHRFRTAMRHSNLPFTCLILTHCHFGSFHFLFNLFFNFPWFYTPAKLIFLISMSKYVLNMVDNNLNWIWLFQHFVRLSWFSVCFLNIVFWLAFISRNSCDILHWPPTCSPMPHIR